MAAAVALFAIVSSPSGDDTAESSATPTPTATATAAADRKRDRGRASGETYTVEPGDTPSGIAAEAGVELDDLIAANPDIEANALTVGEELQLP